MITLTTSTKENISAAIYIFGIVIAPMELIADAAYTLYYGINLMGIAGAIVGILAIYISYKGYMDYKIYKSTLPNV